jgi:hypothetical protein
VGIQDLPLTELLRRASTEADSAKLRDLIQEINLRYERDDPSIEFDVYQGIPDRNPTWVEKVVGLAVANDRMHSLAAGSPGAYFVFHSASGRVLARIDNGPRKATEATESPKTGTA